MHSNERHKRLVFWGLVCAVGLYLLSLHSQCSPLRKHLLDLFLMFRSWSRILKESSTEKINLLSIRYSTPIAEKDGFQMN